MGNAFKMEREAVLLRCGCVLYFESPYPTPGESLICRNCHTSQIVVGDRWSIDCRACRYGRSYKPLTEGSEEYTARAAAARHVLKHADHTVDVYHGATLKETVSNDPQAGEEPFASLVRDRQKLANEQQNLLRGLVNRTAS